VGYRSLNLLTLDGTYLGDIDISNDFQLVSMAPLLDHVSVITGDLRIGGIIAVRELGIGLFSNLISVGGDVDIGSCSGITSMGAAFPALTTVGGYVDVSYNTNLLSIDGSFPVLTSVGGVLHIRQNPVLQSFGPAFPMLTTIGGTLDIFGNTAIPATSVGDAFGALTSIAGFGLTPPGDPEFDASTMIFAGDVYLLPTSNTGSLAESATMLANVRVITGRVLIESHPAGTVLPANFGSNVRMVSGKVEFRTNFFASINGAFTNLVLAGGVSVYSNYGLTTWGNAFSSLQMCFGDLQVANNQNVGLSHLNGIFPQLTTVTGQDLRIEYNYHILTMTGAFPLLEWNTGQITITYNDELTTIEPTAFASLLYTRGLMIEYNKYSAGGLATMEGAFPALQTVGSSLSIVGESRLTSMVGAFPQLTSVGTSFSMSFNEALTGVTNIFGSMTTIGGKLSFYETGGEPFCTAVQSTLCPASTHYFTHDSNGASSAYATSACCTAYCGLATSTC
jgi:hypothetical protein